MRKSATASLTAASKAARLALNPRQAAFVEHYARPVVKRGQAALNASDAARAAGYSHNRADATAQRLLKIPKVKQAVDLMRAAGAERADYTFDAFIDQVDDGLAFAKETKNASAYMQGLITKGKAFGYVVERLDARLAVGSFVFNFIGLDDPPADQPALPIEAPRA